MEFLDRNDKLIDSIALRKTSNHEWFINNRILPPPQRLLDTIPEDATIANPVLVKSLALESDPTAFNRAVPHSLSRKLKDLELWHQRYGHCSPRTLNLTRKCLDGIPDIPSTAAKRLTV